MKLREKYDLLRKTLLEAQKWGLVEPNPDYYERCRVCGRSPHNVQPHDEGCLVPKIRRVLKATE